MNSRGKILQEQVRLTQLEKTMTLLDPKVILKRGYALVSNKDGVIGANHTIKVGEELIIQTAKQELNVEVKKVASTPCLPDRQALSDQAEKD